ncbi:MAG: hypothetical protein JHC93_02725 [Parachlamydiales bacterium]|nr:hypothetical protein [Parachlamydiales bacterium]
MSDHNHQRFISTSQKQEIKSSNVAQSVLKQPYKQFICRKNFSNSSVSVVLLDPFFFSDVKNIICPCLFVNSLSKNPNHLFCLLSEKTRPSFLFPDKRFKLKDGYKKY